MPGIKNEYIKSISSESIRDLDENLLISWECTTECGTVLSPAHV